MRKWITGTFVLLLWHSLYAQEPREGAIPALDATAGNQAVQIKSRIEYVTINRLSNNPESGMLLSQDVVYRPLGSPVDVSVRYALFDTDSYDSRIYTYENNALYVYSIPAYYYRGSRAYVMVRWTLFNRCDLWIRYGTFIYDGRKTLGTGPEAINGNQKSDLTVQLRMGF